MISLLDQLEDWIAEVTNTLPNPSIFRVVVVAAVVAAVVVVVVAVVAAAAGDWGILVPIIG